MGGIGEEDTLEDMDKGPIVYQESKVFKSEPYLISVYDNTVKRFCTFEVYSLDTQFVLSKMYQYADFDNLFRFNAELMNPNRKDGRFHWCIERLEIASIGAETKLRLAPEPSEEVPQLPLYETVRKIPTGRMDLKERQRLREQMDMLDIRRAENISRKRAATRERFRKHIFNLKEEDARRKREQDEKIALERAIRYKTKEEIEKKEEALRQLLAEKAKVRRKAVEVKEQLTEEQEEEVLRQLRSRWKAADAEKARAISDAHERKVKNNAREEQEAKDLSQHRADAQGRRLLYWKGRDERAKKKDDDWLKRQLNKKADALRHGKMQTERNFEYISDVHRDRQPIFEAQLHRTHERACARAAEEEAAGNYKDERKVPKKVKKKGKNASKAKEPGSPEKKPGGKTADKEAPKGKTKKGADKEKDKDKDGKDKGKDKEDKDKDGKKDAKKEEAKKEDDQSSKEDAGGEKTDAKKTDKGKVERALDAVEAKMRAEMDKEKERKKIDKKRTKKIEDCDTARREKENSHNKLVRTTWRDKIAEEDRVTEERRLVVKQLMAERKATDVRKKQELERLQRTREFNMEKKAGEWLEKAHDGRVVAPTSPKSPTAKRALPS